MLSRNLIRVLTLATALAVLASVHVANAAGTLVLRNAAIYTLNAKQPWASALIIRDGRITYVGDDSGTHAVEPDARVIDLQGRLVLPGFHDAHVHPMSGAMRLLLCDLSHSKSVHQLAAAIRAEAAAKPVKPWVFCNGAPQAIAGKLTLAKLDELVPDRPAFIRTGPGFTAWVNSKALSAVGIDPNGTTPEVPGLQRNPKTGKPTGTLTGEATSLVRNKVPPPSQAEYREALRRATAIANRFGITSIFDAAATPDMLDAYHAADVAGELTVRVVAAQWIDPRLGEKQVADFIVRRQHTRGRRFRADAAKIFLDGEIGMHTAAMLAPYADAPDSRGALYVQAVVLDAIVRRLDAAGFLIHMHAMGDAAVRAGLNAIEAAARANGARDRRHQIAHNGVVAPDDIPRFGKLGITANFTPFWFQPDDPAFAPTQAALGSQRSKWMYPMHAVAAAGGRLTIGSDWPQPTMNPVEEIQYAMTRQPLDGSKPPQQPEERISLAAALAAYTKDAAWAVREDAIDGSIEVGKAADLIVLNRNLFKIDVMAIHKTHVLLTLLNGEPVYRDPHFNWPDNR